MRARGARAAVQSVESEDELATHVSAEGHLVRVEEEVGLGVRCRVRLRKRRRVRPRLRPRVRLRVSPRVRVRVEVRV